MKIKIISILLLVAMLLSSCGRLQENVTEKIDNIITKEKKYATLEEDTLANAIIFGYEDTVKEIIDNGEGIDINHFSKSMKWESVKCDNPLSLALACGNEDVAYYLMGEGASPNNVYIDGKNASVGFGKYQFRHLTQYYEMLVKYDYDFDSRTDYGYNAVDILLGKDDRFDSINWEMTEKLLEQGASITAKTIENMLENSDKGNENLPKVVKYLVDTGESTGLEKVYEKAILSYDDEVQNMISNIHDKETLVELSYLIAAYCNDETLKELFEYEPSLECNKTDIIRAASRSGNIDNLKYLIEELKFEEYQGNDTDILAIEIAESNKHYNVVEYLVEQGYPIPDSKWAGKGWGSLIAIDVINQDRERLNSNLFNSERVPSDFMAVMEAAMLIEDYDTYKYLLTYAIESDINLNRKMLFSDCNKDENMINYIINNIDISQDDLNDALDTAVSYGNVESVRVLLEAGADPNTGDIPTSALYRDNLEILKLLVEHGMDINYKTESGIGLLDYASQFSNACLSYLLEQGIDIKKGSGNEYALIVAVNSGRIQNIKTLIEAGIDSTVTNADGRTAYDMAVLAENNRMLKTLEEAGITK